MIDGTLRDLQPFRPGTDGPWDRAAAAHFLRRAAFGAATDRVAAVLERGPVEAARDAVSTSPDAPELDEFDGISRRIGSLDAIRSWWVYRMLRSPAPAREKLALFWHGHFATSDRKVDDARAMMDQVRLFQLQGAGDFGRLLLAVARDPAMIVWLDGNSNRRGRPNENFARELMELFSLGIGNYTEDDIKEAARAFTGWHERGGEFRFSRRAHDDAAKTVFGVTGALGGEDVVRLCVERPACARFIASKLFRFYVHPEPSPALEAALGDLYREVGLVTEEFLARLWSSRIFFRGEARRAIVGSPVDYVIGTLVTLGGRANAEKLASSIELMGQDLLRPPSVKGWDGGLAWLNSTTLLARYRYSVDVVSAELDASLDWGEIGDGGPGGVVDRLFPDGLQAGVREDLLSAADGDLELLVSGCLELPEGQYV